MIKNLIPLTICLLSLLGCKGKVDSGLSANELIAKVNTDSLIPKQTIEEFNFAIDSTKVHFKQKEKRNIAMDAEPVIIDLTKDPEIIREVKLSELGNKIEYIKLTPKDSLHFLKTGRVHIQFSEKYIISSTMPGTSVFTLDGTFHDYISKNEIDVFKYGRDGLAHNPTKFRGIRKPVLLDNILYYIYTDAESNKSALCRYDLSLLDNLNRNKEAELEEMVKGEPLLTVSSGFGKNITQIQLLNKDTWLGFQPFWNPLGKNKLFHSFNMNGDTSCSFTNHDPVLNYKGGPYQVVESSGTYRLGRKVMFKQGYNDTIYQIVSENQMVPRYILYRGEKGLTTREGMTPSSDLTDNIIIDQFYETKNWLIIVTEQPLKATAEDKYPEYYNYWFYNKSSKQLIKHPGNLKTNKLAFKNDINDKMDFFPTQTTKEGWLVMGMPVKYLNEDYSKQELKELFPFETYEDHEYILMILK